VSEAVTKPPPLHSVPTSTLSHRRIFIRDLVIPCRIGIYAHEQTGAQRVRINAQLWVREGTAPLADNIENVVSYEHVVDGMRALAARGHINLVETLAEEIAALCLADSRVERTRVCVEKLDIYDDAASVGVEIERVRSTRA